MTSGSRVPALHPALPAAPSNSEDPTVTRAPWLLVLSAACFLALFEVSPALAQEPSGTSASPQPSPSAGAPAKKKKHNHADDFLVRGTVFTPDGLSFPGVELRIRRSGEKKFRWETYTNSRGEFAVRVPQGADYEVVVRAKGFAEDSRTLDAKNGCEESFVFRMEPVKPGAKK